MNNMNRAYERKETLLAIHDLSLAYGDKLILRDINLMVENLVRPGVNQGQCIALLGPSGIGKTQLFRCIAGFHRPTTGTIHGMNKALIQAGDVGVVQQSYPLLAHRTIRSNLSLVTKDDAKVQALLTRFELQAHDRKYPVQLSGGQRQRVAIIQQLLASRHFLLMDEPFSGLDVIAKDKVCDVINEVSVFDELNTTIFTTHDLEAALQVADTIWLMGREKDKPGATIVKTIDLIERGLAWTPNVETHPAFGPTLHELKTLFKDL